MAIDRLTPAKIIQLGTAAEGRPVAIEEFRWSIRVTPLSVSARSRRTLTGPSFFPAGGSFLHPARIARHADRNVYRTS